MENAGLTIAIVGAGLSIVGVMIALILALKRNG